MRRKVRLATWLERWGMMSLLRALPDLAGRQLRVLNYHRIFDAPGGADFPFDRGLISATPAQFREQMVHVKSHYDPIRFSDLFNWMEHRRALPKRPILITFDDGHADNYTHAFPILRELDIPAAIFVSTQYIDSGELFWFESVAHTIMEAKPGSYRLPGNFGFMDISDAESRRKAIERVLAHIKTLDDAARVAVVAGLKTLMVPGSPDDTALAGALTWDQIREMAKQGIEFGSHSVSHPILTKLDDATLAHELTSSLQTLKRELGTCLDVLAYPEGSTSAFNARVVDATRRAGYRLGLSYVSGTNLLRRFDPFGVKRMHIDASLPAVQFRALLAMPQLFSLELSHPRAQESLAP